VLLGGAICLVVLRDRSNRSPAPAAPSRAPVPPDAASRLQQLAALRANGLLSDEEQESKRREIVASI